MSHSTNSLLFFFPFPPFTQDLTWVCLLSIRTLFPGPSWVVGACTVSDGPLAERLNWINAKEASVSRNRWVFLVNRSNLMYFERSSLTPWHSFSWLRAYQLDSLVENTRKRLAPAIVPYWGFVAHLATHCIPRAEQSFPCESLAHAGWLIPGDSYWKNF